MTKIYSCFPGTGKSHLFRQLQGKIKISDSDSSQFSWITDGDGNRVRNPRFVQDYIGHIKSLIEQKYDIIFVSTHKEVIQALLSEGIEFTIIRPSSHLKDDYIERYKGRGNDEAFVNLMEQNWYKFLEDINEAPAPKITLMRPESYVSSAINLPIDVE